MITEMSRTAGSTRAAVVRSSREYSLVVAEPVDAGAHLFAIDGELTDHPSRYSVQVGHALHVDLPESYGLELVLDRFFWRFMNHSCEPTAAVRGREVFSLRPLQAWQEITFHYNTTEYELAEPFDCRCGSSRCEGRIRGFRFLSRPDRERLRPWLSAHLLAILDGRVAEPAATVEEPLCR